MTLSIREVMEADARHEASTDGLWEWVSFHPGGGGPVRQVMVNIHLTEMRETQDHVERADRTVQVVAFKNEEDEEKGGIARPYKEVREADAFTRAGETQRYVYTGRVISETPHSWLLEYKAPAGTRTGTDTTRG
jgi:hypothetical protein